MILTSLIQETRLEQLEAVDKLTSEITKRTVQMNTLHELFAFLQIQTLLDAEKDDLIVRHIQHLCVKYSDLNATAMTAEIHRIRWAS